MKKYAIYRSWNGDYATSVLIREADSIRAACKEAYRLSRCAYRCNQSRISLIVGINVGMQINTRFTELMRYNEECAEENYKKIYLISPPWRSNYKRINIVKRSVYDFIGGAWK